MRFKIENVASDFRKALSTILDGTWDFVNEKEEDALGVLTPIHRNCH